MPEHEGLLFLRPQADKAAVNPLFGRYCLRENPFAPYDACPYMVQLCDNHHDLRMFLTNTWQSTLGSYASTLS